MRRESSTELEVEQLTLPSGQAVRVPILRLKFDPWKGISVPDPMGRKQAVQGTGRLLFAELAVLEQLRTNGREGLRKCGKRRHGRGKCAATRPRR